MAILKLIYKISSLLIIHVESGLYVHITKQFDPELQNTTKHTYCSFIKKTNLSENGEWISLSDT